ncbi:MAG: CBS domain-containing protein [Eubacteriales bacterium]
MNILFFLRPKSNIAYIYEHDTLRQALEKVRYHGYTAIPVISDDGKYVGTLSEGDLLWAILDHCAFDNRIREQFCVKDILKGRQYSPVNVNSAIEDLLLAAMNQNFIPVTDDRDLFIGIVTRKDIMQHYYDVMNKAIKV